MNQNYNEVNTTVTTTDHERYTLLYKQLFFNYLDLYTKFDRLMSTSCCNTFFLKTTKRIYELLKSVLEFDNPQLMFLSIFNLMQENQLK